MHDNLFLKRILSRPKPTFLPIFVPTGNIPTFIPLSCWAIVFSFDVGSMSFYSPPTTSLTSPSLLHHLHIAPNLRNHSQIVPVSSMPWVFCIFSFVAWIFQSDFVYLILSIHILIKQTLMHSVLFYILVTVPTFPDHFTTNRHTD